MSIDLAKRFLTDEETLEKGSPLRELISKGESTDLIPIIDYFWGRRKVLVLDKYILQDYIHMDASKQRQKIIYFWKCLYIKYLRKSSNNDLNDDDKKVLSYLPKLTCFLVAITEEKQNWLLQAAPYVNDEVKPLFIEYLENLQDKGIKEISRKNIDEIHKIIL